MPSRENALSDLNGAHDDEGDVEPADAVERAADGGAAHLGHVHRRPRPREDLADRVLGPDSDRKIQLEFWLEKSLESWLEIPYTKKKFNNC